MTGDTIEGFPIRLNGRVLGRMIVAEVESDTGKSSRSVCVCGVCVCVCV